MKERVIVTVVWAVLWPVATVAWFGIGLVSMRRLGQVLERTGCNLQEYTW